MCAGRYTPIEIVADGRKWVYSVTHWNSLKSGKVLWVRYEERQITLHKWKEWLSETHQLIHDLEMWLERGHGQMNFYQTQVMSGHGVYNAYLFRMKLAERPKCTNCDRRGRDDDAWHTLFECPTFQLYQEDVMTTQQKKNEQLFTPENWSQLC